MSRGQRAKTGVGLAVGEALQGERSGARQDADGCARPVGAPPDAGEPIEASPLYGVALLKAAMELKRRPDQQLEEILSGVLARMRIPEEEFHRYLAQNGGLLRNIAERKRY
jgi:hypothetical protein